MVKHYLPGMTQGMPGVLFSMATKKKKAIMFVDGNNWHSRNKVSRGLRSLRSSVFGRFARRSLGDGGFFYGN